MKKYLSIAGILLILALIAYALAGAQGSAEPQAADSYKTASYDLSGTAKALGSGTARYFGNEARGDLNGDGREDVAFIIVDQPGGSGTFYYVAAALGTAQGYEPAGALLLGDRIAPQNTLIDGGDVVVNYADRKANEPMSTAPSVGITSYFSIKNGKLVYAGSR